MRLMILRITMLTLPMAFSQIAKMALLTLIDIHNCFGPPSTGSTPSSFYHLVEMGLPLQAIVSLELFLGFLGKGHGKAYTKLTIVMCFQTVDKKSVAAAIFGGDRRCSKPVDKIRNFEEKNFK